MKSLLVAAILALVCIAPRATSQTNATHSAMHADFDAPSRFIFYCVLEGLYEDGLSDEDVGQILMRGTGGQPFFHFVYACPICNPTIWALQTYRARPARFFSLKTSASNFGPGLSDDLHRQLCSSDAQQRLTAINTLVKKWMERRMTSLRLSETERKALLAELEEMRKKGGNMLNGHRPPAVDTAASAWAYVKGGECAVCNGAVGKPCKLMEPDK